MRAANNALDRYILSVAIDLGALVVVPWPYLDNISNTVVEKLHLHV